MIFFTSAHCTSGAHCGYCRLKTHEKGTNFRQDLVNNWEDIESADFDCPHGKPWVTEDEEAYALALSLERIKASTDDPAILAIYTAPCRKSAFKVRNKK